MLQSLKVLHLMLLRLMSKSMLSVFPRLCVFKYTVGLLRLTGLRSLLHQYHPLMYIVILCCRVERGYDE